MASTAVATTMGETAVHTLEHDTSSAMPGAPR